ncbi:MAG: hypothetical protein OSA21_03265, partial [Candidatus Poseidoniaceae archaeon]|nr:hypothetical protein [Candidatus Poseidoniaceae archaeon]
NICANDDCTDIESDWATSTTDRDFYGWTVTNAAEVANGSAPTHEKIGPVTYTITSDRTFTSHNSTAGTITYHENTSYACSVDTVVPCDVEITQLNIGFTPQVIGATGLAVNGIMELTKVGFSAGMLGNDLENMQAGAATATTISAQIAGASAQMQSMGMPEANAAAAAPAAVANGWFSAFDIYFAAINGSQMNNMTGNGETITYSQATGQTADFTNVSTAMDTAMMPTGESAALTGELGVLLFAGHCAAYSTANSTEIMADAANGFANVGTMQRATIWGYMAMANATTPDFETTIARDHAACYGVGGTFLTYGGGDATWFATPTTSVNASSRFANLGITIDNTVAMNLLFAGDDTDAPTGLLASNADSTAFGLATFMQMDPASAMTAFGLDATQYGAIAMWAGAWLTDAKSLPMVLKGGTGDMTASLFVNTTFGSADSLNGGYLSNSLNMGGAWGAGLIPGHSDATAISITPEQAGNILYGPLGLTTSAGATLFMYGELSGMTPPINFVTMEAGTPMTWNATTISMLYGIDANAAEALSFFVASPIFAEFVPGFLVSSFGTTPYLTQEFNNWLLGWHDPVVAFLASGNPMDMTVGWTSLESNSTYYGSGGIVSDTGTDYTICTGEVSSCDKGEMMAVDGSEYFAWKDDVKMAATYGLITAESRIGTTGGFLTMDGDMVDLSGYATAEIACTGTSTLKNIAVDDCSASLDPLTRPIQAKLLNTGTLLDAMPGALPVYFGSEVTLQAEQLSGAIIAGSSESTFWLDMRPITEQHTAPNASNLQAVFSIESSSEIGDADAEDLSSKVTTNQEALTYWTNFDVPTDYLAPLLYLGAIVCLVMAARKNE